MTSMDPREDGWIPCGVQLLEALLTVAKSIHIKFKLCTSKIFPSSFIRPHFPQNSQCTKQTMHSYFVYLVSGIFFRQCTFNCFRCREIHPLSSCMLINLIQLSDDVLSDRAECSPLSSFKRLTELSHQFSFHISTASIPKRSTVLTVIWTGRPTIKWL